MKTRCYGWKRPDPQKLERAFKFSPKFSAAALPPATDLRPTIIPKYHYDQGQLGSCTANAIGALGQSLLIRQKATVFQPSRNFIYYQERLMEGTVSTDSGAELADGMSVVSTYGVPPEPLWPYSGKRWLWQPSPAVYTEAAKHKYSQELNIPQDLNSLKGCLATGFPFVFGFVVYDSFESDEVAKTGIVGMPKKGESAVGGHAVLAVGYNSAKRVFIIRNSWGDDWGMGGDFTLPFDYVLNKNLSSDFWTSHQIAA